ncbi:hypothetical protein TWF696_009049 [Orbilia brochopaga]|uniref:Uncharacterized protein n=1 Tax=Orbilia brochopaga TaxID=3140254 RepID=A0AAV9UIH3_9PEZI
MTTIYKILSVSLGKEQVLIPTVDESGCSPAFSVDENVLWDKEDRTDPNPPIRVQTIDATQDSTVLKVCIKAVETQDDRASREKLTANPDNWGSAEEIIALKRVGIVLRLFAETDKYSRREIAYTSLLSSTSDGTAPTMTFEFSSVDLKPMASPNRARGEPWHLSVDYRSS